MIERRKADSGGRRLNKGRRIEDGTDMKRSYILPHFAVTPAPAIPTALTVSAASSSQINLSWVASAGPALKDYGVYRQGAGILGFVTATSFSDTGLTPSTSYTYFVTARNLSLVESAPSNFASATTNASGTLTHGQPATFNGSGFGTKSRGLAPLLDDYGQAGVGVVDPQWNGGARMAAVDSYSAYNILNQATNFNPTGANVGPPHPYVSSFLAGAHYGDVNADAPWSVYVAKQVTIPTLPAVLYACWYERQDPLSALNLGHGAGANLKMFGVSSTAGGIVADTYVFVMLPGSFNNTDAGYSCILAQNGSTLEIVSNLFGNQELNPYNASNGWKFVEVEITLDARLLAAGGVGTIQRYVNGVKMFAVPYVGRTDSGSGTVRYVTIGGGVFTNDYGDATHTPTAIKNWSYLADAKYDITGAGVTGSCARLYLTNASTLAASTLFSYQPSLSAWGNTQIQVSAVRRGPLAAGNVWAHVVPEAGRALSVALGPFTMAASP